jgi:ABC-type transport system involved in multi-copper enzyme maturation permease subunit
MTKVWTLAKHEYRAAARSKALTVLLATFIIVTTVSILIAAYTFKSKLADYNTYKIAAQAAKQTYIAAPQLFPLQLLRGAIEYVEIIGSVIAIALGYVSVARERSNRTMPLLLSRPVTTVQLVSGRIFGAFCIFASIITITGFIAVIAIGAIGNTWLTAGELGRLAIAYGLSVVYMLLLYCLGAILTLRSRVPINGLITGFALWLLIVMIMPQIGDTIASIEKHYERFNFAVTGIKDQYNQRPLAEVVAAKRSDLGWLGGGLIVLFGGLTVSMRRKYMTR